MTDYEGLPAVLRQAIKCKVLSPVAFTVSARKDLHQNVQYVQLSSAAFVFTLLSGKLMGWDCEWVYDFACRPPSPPPYKIKKIRLCNILQLPICAFSCGAKLSALTFIDSALFVTELI